MFPPMWERLCVAGVEEVSAECNAEVRSVITHSLARHMSSYLHSLINRDGLKKETAGNVQETVLQSSDFITDFMFHTSHFSPGVQLECLLEEKRYFLK